MGSEGVLDSGWELSVSQESLDEGENIIYVYAYDDSNNYSTANAKVNIIKDDGSGSSVSDGQIVEYM